MIEGILGAIDGVIYARSQDLFDALAGDIGTLIVILGVMGLGFLSLNMMFQMVPIMPSVYIAWGIRYVIIAALATSWVNFVPIYSAVVALPDSFANSMMGTTGETTTSGLQEVSDEIFRRYDEMIASAGLTSFGIHLQAMFIFVLGIILVCASVVVIGTAKIGLAIALGLGPIFIASLLFKPTSDLFGSWSKFVLNFIMVIVLVAAMVSIVSGIMNTISTSSVGATTLDGMVSLLVIGVAMIFFLAMIPNYAMALSGSIAGGAMSVVAAAQTMRSGASAAVGGGAKKADQGYTGAVVGNAMRKEASAGYQQARAEGKSKAVAAWVATKHANTARRMSYMESWRGSNAVRHAARNFNKDK